MGVYSTKSCHDINFAGTGCVCVCMGVCGVGVGGWVYVCVCVLGGGGDTGCWHHSLRIEHQSNVNDWQKSLQQVQ